MYRLAIFIFTFFIFNTCLTAQDSLKSEKESTSLCDEQQTDMPCWQMIKAQLGQMHTRLEQQETRFKKVQQATMWSILAGVLTYALLEVLDTMHPNLPDMRRLKKIQGFEKLTLFASACTYACLYFFQK